MGKKLVSRTAKVLSETKKVKDKEAIAIAYEHIPRNPEEQKHGSIYAVIELEDKSGHAEEIAEKIIDVLHDNYYEDTEKDPLEALEASLAKINEELADRSSEGQINWLGNLNAVLGVLSENTLHVTQTGKAQAYLYRGEHSMNITDDLTGDSINPQRTFINIASGDLAEKDRIALVTPGVFYKISKSELKKFATESSPKIAVENLSKLLSGENGTTTPNAVLLMEMLSPESLAAEPEAEEQTDVWIEEKGRPIEDVTEGVAGGAVKTFDFLGKVFGSASAFIATQIVPRAKSGIASAKKKIGGFKKEPGAESVILSSEERIELERANDLDIDTDDGILESPLDEPQREIRIKETKRRPRLLSLEHFNFSPIDKMKSLFGGGSRGRGLKVPGGKFSFLYLVIGLAILAGTVGYVYYAKMGNPASVTQNTAYADALAKYDQAISQIQSGDNKNALLNLDEAQALAESVPSDSADKSQANELLTKISQAKDKAQKITRNTATVFHEFTKTVSAIYMGKDLIYGIDFKTGSIYSVDPQSKAQATILANPKIDGAVIYATLVESRNVMVFGTKNNKLYEVDLNKKELSAQTVSGELEKAEKIGNFFSNIYLLSKTDNQIYKHFSTSFGYGRKGDYFDTEEDLSGVVDFAIDGSIYTVTATGKVQKYTSGVKDKYTVSGLPQSYSDISGIHTSADTTGLYLFSADRVIKIDAKGKFVAQYANDEVSAISSVIARDDLKSVLFLSENKIYAISSK